MVDHWCFIYLKFQNHCSISSDATAVRYATFGAGLGPIHLDDVSCVGFENNLVDCPYDSHTADCLHLEDAGVRCRRMSISQL